MRHAQDLPRCRSLGGGLVPIDTWWCRRTCDPIWRLYRNRDAGAAIQHERGRIALEAGRFYLVPAWTLFRGRCPGPIRHDVVHFQVAGLPSPWLRRLALPPCGLDAEAWWGATMESVAERMHPSALLRLEAMLCSAVAQALADVPEAAAPDPGAAVAEAALRWLEDQPARHVPVAELARACRVTPDHLTRCFQAAFGVTPSRWLLERRITTAADRLLAGDAGIDEVAAQCGFADRCHFTRAFRRILATTPAAYRRELGRSLPSARLTRP